MDEMTGNIGISTDQVCSVCEKVTRHVNYKCRECTLREATWPTLGEWVTNTDTGRTFFVAGYNTKHTILFDLTGGANSRSVCRPAKHEEIESNVIEMMEMAWRDAKRCQDYSIWR